MAAEPLARRPRGDLASRLAHLSRELGDPARDYAILAIGDVHAARIAGRADEHYRRSVLARGAG